MKLIFLLVLTLSTLSLFFAHKSHKVSNKLHKKSRGPVGQDTPPHAAIHGVLKPRPNPILTIPFGPKAKLVNDRINSLGERVNKHVVFPGFPFRVKRCDQIVLFPATYINDEDDFRERNEGYVAITAHYTNLFADKDGQKLIQQNISTQTKRLPKLLSGARGCIRVYGGIRQKNLNICTKSKNNANNLLEVYSDFARCRLGDNLSPIPADTLKELMKLCGVSRVSLEGPNAAAAMDKLEKMVDERNKRMVSGQTKFPDVGKGKNKLSPSQKAEFEKRLMKKKKLNGPDFFIPKGNNAWERDRRNYVHYTKLRVPGSRRRRFR